MKKLTIVAVILGLSLSAFGADAPKNLSAKEQQVIRHFVNLANEPDGSFFTIPQGWAPADPENLPPHVKLMVVGKGKNPYPPSINLTVEPFSGSVNDYLKIVKDINKSHGRNWQSLGTIEHGDGTASLSQVESQTQWGKVRMMHLIATHKGSVHIMTAAALKEEFSQFYPEFFKAMQSFRFNKGAIEMLPENKQAELKQSCNDVKVSLYGSGQSFDNPTFQQEKWQPFKAHIARQYADMGELWQKSLFSSIEEELRTQNHTSNNR